MKELIGKKIIGVSIDKTYNDVLAFFTEDETLIYTCWGDCCSETWFADILGIENLINQEVTNVEDINLEDIQDGRSRQDSDEFYGIKITTIKGVVDIIYRNSSNGYYSGSCDFGGKLSENMVLITNDWIS